MENIISFFKRLKRSFEAISIPLGLKFWITAICLCFVVNTIAVNFEKLSNQSITSSSYLLLSIGLIISWFSLIVNALAWKKIVFWLGCQSNSVEFIPLFLTTNILKYIPGGIWHFVERFRFLRKHINKREAFYAVVIEPFFMIVAALFFVPFGEFNLLIIIVCFLPLLLFSSYFRKPIFVLLSRLKATDFNNIDSDITIQKLSYSSAQVTSNYPFQALTIEIIFVLLRFVGFWFCLFAFSIHDSLGTGNWLSIFSLCWIVGFVIPSAPGGVGVFEAFLLLIIRDSVPETSLLSALLCYRLIVSLADLFAAIFANSKKTKLISRFKSFRDLSILR